MKLSQSSQGKLSDAKSGFTLIELLVVVSIISLLSSVVLAGFSSARESAREAAILQSLSNAQTQAELYYNQNSSYSGLCEDEQIKRIVASASSTGDGAACWEATDYYPNPDSRAQLADKEFGVAATRDKNYHVASEAGLVTFSPEMDGISSLPGAKKTCNDAGKRLPTASEFIAISSIKETTPDGFSTAYYFWSTSRPSSGSIYRIDVYDGGSISVTGDSGSLAYYCVGQ